MSPEQIVAVGTALAVVLRAVLTSWRASKRASQLRERV
jgi:hypothetical protein